MKTVAGVAFWSVWKIKFIKVQLKLQKLSNRKKKHKPVSGHHMEHIYYVLSKSNENCKRSSIFKVFKMLHFEKVKLKTKDLSDLKKKQ